MEVVTTKLTPAEIAALSNAELSELVTKLGGWTARPFGIEKLFADSIDAQQAPGGPEEIGRSRGWEMSIRVWQGDIYVTAHLLDGTTLTPIEDHHKLEPRLRLEAWALALQEGM